MDLPTKIRGIKQPTWTDTLTWGPVRDGLRTAEVDHDWRIWVSDTGRAYVRNKGWGKTDQFANLDEALAFLDYRVDA